MIASLARVACENPYRAHTATCPIRMVAPRVVCPRAVLQSKTKSLSVAPAPDFSLRGSSRGSTRASGLPTCMLQESTPGTCQPGSENCQNDAQSADIHNLGEYLLLTYVGGIADAMLWRDRVLILRPHSPPPHPLFHRVLHPSPSRLPPSPSLLPPSVVLAGAMFCSGPYPRNRLVRRRAMGS